MMVPGSNLLAMAMSVITPQAVVYYEWTGKTTNSQGVDVATYAEPRTVYGSFQPVPREKFEMLGLEFSSEAATFYATGRYRPILRNSQPDQFAYGGRKWEVKGLVDWFSQDGWEAVLLQDVGPV